jgi:CBS domain-containing protein
MATFDEFDEESASEFEDAYADRRQIHGAIFHEPLGNVPRRTLVTVTTQTSLGDTIRAMNDSHVGCCLVVAEGKLVGIFTERDVLRKVTGRGLDFEKITVDKVMTRDPDTLPATATVAYAMHKMSVDGYRHVPLVDEQRRPTGVVAVRDIVAWMVDMFPEEVLNLPPEPGFPKGTDGG